MAKTQCLAKRSLPDLDYVYARLRRCSTRQRLAVCCFMSELVNGSPVAAIIDRTAREYLCCPRCKGRRFCRHGFANGLQRYRCSDCARTFNGLSGTPLARLRLKHKWLLYCDCLRDAACTVKSAAEQVAVHPNTSFRWRHRFLQWAKLDRARALQGIAEVQGTVLLASEKGSKQLTRKPRKRGGPCASKSNADQLVHIVTARDRSGATIDFIAGRGALEVSALDTHLLPKLPPDVILVSGMDPVYRVFVQEARIDHQIIVPRQGARAHMAGQLAIHLQNVQAYHGRFKDWLRHFNGVAARYLDNYLGWRWAIDMERIASAEAFLRAALRGCPRSRPFAINI